MANTVDEAFSKMSLYSDDVPYVLLTLPANAITAAAAVVAEHGQPFCCMIVDKDEITLMLPHDTLDEFAHRLPEHIAAETHYRLITFDVALDLSMVGFMARVSKALADVRVSIIPYAAYTRDHIFVPADNFPTAWATLLQLQNI